MPEKNKGILMEDVRLLPGSYRNFTGRPSKYNKIGDRNFSVILPPDVAEEMMRDGFNVKQTKARPGDDGEELGQEYYVKINVKFEFKPPRIILMTSRGRNPLGENMVEMLDYADIEVVDLIANPNPYDIRGEKGWSLYLKSMYVKIHEDELDLKYGFDPMADQVPTPDEED